MFLPDYFEKYSIDKEKAWQVLNYLQAENKVRMDKNGLLVIQT